MRLATAILLITCGLLSGCQPRPPVPRAAGATAKPLVFQLQQQDDSLQDQRIRTLLDFENESDLVFAQSDSKIAIDPLAHTGKSAMRVDGTSVIFRIYSILFDTDFPGNWTLLGAYVRPQVNTPVLAELLAGGQVVASTRNTIPADRWSFAGIDISRLNTAVISSARERLMFRLTFESAGALATTLIDNVVLIDNRKTLIDTMESDRLGWKISRCGYITTIDAPGRFKIDAVAAATHDKGWVLSEYSALRAVLRSAGAIKTWVLYRDGRCIEDGRMTVKGAKGDAAIAAHLKPALVAVDETTGKLNRHTEGDLDNDGYNERLGAYQIDATVARVQLKITHAGVDAASPVFEIAGMPDGKLSATVEGRLIQSASRLGDGKVLVVIPLLIDRPMSITVVSIPQP